jgi:lipoprotein-releasing system permease protein
MFFEYFVAKRITFQSRRSFSKLVVRLAVAAIALSLAVMLISIAVIRGFQGEIKQKVISFGSHIQVSSYELTESLRSDPIRLSEDRLDTIRTLPLVKHVQAFANKPGILRAGETIEGVVLRGAGPDFDWSQFRPQILKGEALSWTDSATSDQLLLAQDLADQLNVDTGDRAVMYFVQKPTRVRKFTISGIFNTGLDDVDEVFALADIRHVRELNNWDSGAVGGYQVRLNSLKATAPAVQVLNQLIPAQLQAQSIQEIFPQIFDWLGLLNFNVEIILILMALVASINMITALLIMILERTQFIGLLKALGAANASVMRVFIYNAAFLIGIGILWGNVLGLSLIFLQDTLEVVKLSEASYYLSVVPVYYEWGLFLAINIGAFLFCALSMILPAILVSSVTPVKALRFD